MVPPKAARTTVDAQGLGQGGATAVILGTEDDVLVQGGSRR